MWRHRFARIVGNFGITFFTTFLSFNFVMSIPTQDVVVGALLSSGVVAGLSLSYEVKKYGEGKRSQR